MNGYSFRSALLAIVGVVALSAIVKDDRVVRPLDSKVTIPGDLVVTGTTDTTGETIARAGVRLTAPTTGPIVRSGTGNPNGLVAATLGSMFLRTDTAAVYQNTDGVVAWSQVGGGGGGGSPSLGPLSSSSELLSTSTICDVNLTAASTYDWLTFSGGTAGWSVQEYDEAGTLAYHQRDSKRLWDGVYMVGLAVAARSPVAYGGMDVTATDASNETGSVTVGVQLAWSNSVAGYGYGVDIDMLANETSTLVTCFAIASTGVRVQASFLDGTVAALDTTIANPDPGGGNRYAVRVSIPYTNGNVAANRLRLLVTTVGAFGPFTGELDPTFIYH